ncbi:MAG: ribosomal protein L13e [Nitrospinae bacterium]|nr:ribosomal protein L13e [Nitrospinota bacterium]
MDEIPDAPEPQSAAALYEEYGLDIELLTERESSESAGEYEPPLEHEVSAPDAVESVIEESAPGPEVVQEIEPEAADNSVQEAEEPEVASTPEESPDTTAPQSEAALYEEYGLDLELLTERESSESAGEYEPPLEHEVSAPDAVESVMGESAPGPGVVQEIGPEAADDSVQEAEEPVAASTPEESPDTTAPQSAAALYEEYGLDIELLTEQESEASPGEPVPALLEPSLEDEVSSLDPAAAGPPLEDEVDVSAPERESPEGSEPAAVDESVQEVKDPLVAPEVVETRDAPVPQSEAAPYEEYGLDIESLTETESAYSAGEPEPSLDEPSLEDEAAAPVAVDSAVEASASEPETARESETEAAEDIMEEVEEPPAAPVMQEPPEGLPEPPSAESGFIPLVRDSRGVWRLGKGFSRSELREAGLSLADAARLRIRVDKRRRNTHRVNVAALERAKSGV